MTGKSRQAASETGFLGHSFVLGTIAGTRSASANTPQAISGMTHALHGIDSPAGTRV